MPGISARASATVGASARDELKETANAAGWRLHSCAAKARSCTGR
jgi:hypothetical protein